jgi:hypothetical protein
VAPARLRGTPFVDVGDLHAWGNRLGAPKATEKQRLLDAMDEQLAALNVNPDDANEIKRSQVLGDFSFSFCSELTYLAPIPDCRVIGADILHDKNRVLDPGRITHSKRRS